MYRCLLELGAKHSEHVIDSFLFEVGLLNKHLSRSVEHCLGGVESDALDGIDDPLVDFVGELVEIDILVGFLFVHLPEHVDGLDGEH